MSRRRIGLCAVAHTYANVADESCAVCIVSCFEPSSYLLHRVDVGLFLAWNESSGRQEIFPRINELGWVNDASESSLHLITV
jgi:hypothetical protein